MVGTIYAEPAVIQASRIEDLPMNAIVRTKRSQWLRRFALGCTLVGSLVMIVGCKGSGEKKDPLLGPIVPPAGKSVGTGPGVPEIPSSSGTTSTAALAPGNNGTMGRGDLRIGEGTNFQAVGRGGASLGKPEPIRDTVTSAAPSPLTVSSPAPITLTGGPGTQLQTVEQGLAWLEARGARGARLDYQHQAQEWKFVCSVPNKNNPKMWRTHETQARDPRSAVQAVIEQIEREQK